MQNVFSFSGVSVGLVALLSCWYVVQSCRCSTVIGVTPKIHMYVSPQMVIESAVSSPQAPHYHMVFSGELVHVFINVVAGMLFQPSLLPL